MVTSYFMATDQTFHSDIVIIKKNVKREFDKIYNGEISNKPPPERQGELVPASWRWSANMDQNSDGF